MESASADVLDGSHARIGGSRGLQGRLEENWILMHGLLFGDGEASTVTLVDPDCKERSTDTMHQQTRAP